MSDISVLKSNLRRRLMRDLKRLPRERIKLDSLAVRRRLIPFLEGFPKGRSGVPVKAAVFAARPYEVDLMPLVSLLPEVDWFFPVCVAPMELVFKKVVDVDRDLHIGFKGIREPNEDLPVCEPNDLDVIITPGAGFSLDGKRLGFGGGFYDRFFTRAMKAVKIGVCLPCQICDDIPREEHDFLVDYVAAAGCGNTLPAG